MTNEQKTQNLIQYLNFLLNKKHIEIRSTLDRYRQKLLFGDTLSPTEFETLLKFMVRDFSTSKKEFRNLYNYLIVDPSEKQSRSIPNDLTAFFV